MACSAYISIVFLYVIYIHWPSFDLRCESGTYIGPISSVGFFRLSQLAASCQCTLYFVCMIFKPLLKCRCTLYFVYMIFQQFPTTIKVNGTQQIHCDVNLISSFVVPDILLLVTYIYGVYCYRTLDVQDNLENLADMVSYILQCSFVHSYW